LLSSGGIYTYIFSGNGTTGTAVYTQEPDKDRFILRCQQVQLGHDPVVWCIVFTFVLPDGITAYLLH
jgi:hypothetical protein